MSDHSNCNCDQALELIVEVAQLKLKLGKAFDKLLAERARVAELEAELKALKEKR